MSDFEKRRLRWLNEAHKTIANAPPPKPRPAEKPRSPKPARRPASDWMRSVAAELEAEARVALFDARVLREAAAILERP